MGLNLSEYVENYGDSFFKVKNHFYIVKKLIFIDFLKNPEKRAKKPTKRDFRGGTKVKIAKQRFH